MQQLKRFAHAPRWMRRMQGLSMVELLISVVLGLLVVAAGGTIAVATITSSRRGMVEARLEQDVRSALSVVERELRRAGYWSNAMYEGRKPDPNQAAVRNPHVPITVTGSKQVDYTYSSKVLDSDMIPTEDFSIRLLEDAQVGTGVLQIRRDKQGSWEPLTDPDTVRITAFNVNLDTQLSKKVPTSKDCCKCPVTNPAPQCPGIHLRAYSIQLTGVSRTDTSLSKTLATTVRVRNDQILDNVCSPCPAP